MLGKLKDLESGNEAIRFQMGSPLATELIAIFQSGIDAYNNYGKDKSGTINTMDLNHKRCKFISDFTTKMIVPKFKAAVLKHCNITITSVYTNNTSPFVPNGCFAVDISFKNLYGAVTAINRFSGLDGAPSNAKVQKDYIKFTTLAEAWDEDSPRLSKTTYSKNPKVTISAVMYFDPICAFCMTDFIPAGVLPEAMTAREIAAIMLHEIGHANTVIERSADTYMQNKRMVATIEGLRKQPVTQVIDDYANPMIEQVNSLEKEGGIDKETHATIINVMTNAKMIRKELTETNGNIAVSVLRAIGTVVFYVFMFVLFAWFQGFLILLMVRRLTDLNESLVLRGANSGEKVSDTRSTVHNMRMLERIADEYVSRHGMSADLASGLHRLITYINHVGMLPVVDKRLRESRAMAEFIKIMAVLNDAIGFTNGYNTTYEPTYARIKRMGENTIKVFKDTTMPAQMRDMYIADYEQAVAALKPATPGMAKKMWDTVARIMSDFTSPARIASKLNSGDLNKDYELLADQVDRIGNNKLFYHGAKLTSLAEKK